jgi:hypothetical protein
MENQKMELTVDTYRAWVQSQRKPQAPKPSLDVEKAIHIKQAQQTDDRSRFQAMRRNLTNPMFHIHL